MSTLTFLYKIVHKNLFLFYNHKKNMSKCSNQAAVDTKTPTLIFLTANNQSWSNRAIPASCNKITTMNRSKFTTNILINNQVNAHIAPKSILNNVNITSTIAKYQSFASNATDTSTFASSHNIYQDNAKTHTYSLNAENAVWRSNFNRAISTSGETLAETKKESIGNAASFAVRISSLKINFGSSMHMNADIYHQDRNILLSKSRMNDLERFIVQNAY